MTDSGSSVIAAFADNEYEKSWIANRYQGGVIRFLPGQFDPELVTNNLNRGDILVVWTLARLGRCGTEIMDMLLELNRAGIDVTSMLEAIETKTPKRGGLFRLIALLRDRSANSQIRENEREVSSKHTSARIRAGLSAAKRRGKILGRPHKITDDDVEAAQRLIDSGVPTSDVASRLGVSRSTLYRRLKGASTPKPQAVPT